MSTTTAAAPTPTERRLTPAQIAALDPYQLMAALGKSVIHPGGRRSTEELLDLAAIKPDERVLDIGCGVATTAAELAASVGCKVVAVDIDEAMLTKARQTVELAGTGDRVKVLKGDVLALEFDDEEFDAVIVEAVTMFVDRPRAVSEITRVCRRGGRIVDHEFIWRKPPSPAAREIFTEQVCPGISFDSAEDWIRLYERAGVSNLRSTTGPFAMMTPAGFLHDEGVLGSARIFATAFSRLSHVRKMAWLMPRMIRSMPYLGYVVVSGTRAEPATTTEQTTRSGSET
jgi:ubiquinone/menaquinone biosynthesis C-methylase UbiE